MMRTHNLCFALTVMLLASVSACPEDGTSDQDAQSADAQTETIGGGDGTAADAALDVVVPDVVADITPEIPEEIVVSADFGQPCDENQDCDSGWCVPGQDGDVCTDTCVETANCPDGYVCKPTISSTNATVYLCQPPILDHCAICAADEQCDTGACVTLDGEGRCIYPCDSDADCPANYGCVEAPDGQLPGTTHCFPATGSCTCNAYVQGGVRTCLESNGFGTCYGVQVCKTSAGWTACSADLPTTELCDGEDNDCNGLIDDALVIGEPCQNTVEGVGSCSGSTLCSGADGLLCQAPVPTLESCDGQDNDCDDAIDEDFKDANGDWTLNEHCGYCGNDCFDKIVNGVGACGGTPEGPVCVVDSCDEGYVKVNDFQCLPPIDVTCAACAQDSDCLGGSCIDFDNQQVCMSPCDAAGGSCPPSTSCADVDGTTLCLPDSASCSCDLASAGNTRPCLNINAAGTCQGLETCDPSQGWLGCTALVAEPEICDGLDNDCDGIIDDGIGVETCQNDVPGVGSCPGPNICEGLAGWVCQAETPAVESCDYQDNDCDGAVDEDFTDSNGAYTLDTHCGSCGLDCTDKVLNGTGQCGGPPEAPACEVGSCDPGYYQVGPLACLPASDDLCAPCVNDEGCPTPGDSCLQLDGAGFCGRDCSANNLHGTDEDFCPSGFSCVADGAGNKQCQPESGSCTCLQGDSGDVRPCAYTTATGQCLGQETCDPVAGWVGCTAQATPETCNFIDDDCDGEVDEDFSDLLTACSDGQGVCKDYGLITCNSSGTGTVCSAQAGTGTADICDGLDNNCDGTPDEDFPDLYVPCDVGQGICKRYGYIACTADGSGTECNATEAEAGSEICDGLDNNCDGFTDEDFPTLGDLCTAGDGPCKNTGLIQCDASGTGVECSAVGGTGDAETCDNLDNDCDSETDETFPNKGTVCTVGQGICANAGVWQCNSALDGTVCSVQPLVGGDETCNGLDDDCNGPVDDNLVAPPCALTSGVCAGAVQTCAGLSGWLPCSAPEYGPDYQAIEATCDGLDNDCDGAADNGLTAPPCALQQGLCAGSFKTCGGSDGWSACGVDEYGPSFELDETRCDGVDNDCDGLVDEGFPTLGEVCIEGVGACQVAGTVVCNAAGDATQCSQTAGAEVPELCDGEDNDCDGAVDEDFPGLGQVCVDGKGVCQVTGTGICNAAGDAVTCSETAPSGGLETCDGLDNNCDGKVDELWTKLGQVCVVGTGACQATGTTICNANEDGTTCSATEGTPQAEVCDGIDNNCDGELDELWTVGQVCVVGVGECQATGTYLCNGAGDDVICSATQGDPVAEVCDGLDNDCDTFVDEAWTELGQICVVGTGACQATGTNVCDAGGADVVCSASEGSPVPESCDGVDNNCDGDTDEDWNTLGQVCVVGTGECQATGTNQCNVAGSDVACSATPSVGVTEICDGLDNDCDGPTDEDWPELGTVCNAGEGECIATGTWSCNSNGSGTTCGATPSSGTAEVCDSLDNDCDGATDEDFKDTQGSGDYDDDAACGNCFTDCTVIYGGLDNAYGACDVSGGGPTCALRCCYVGIDTVQFPQCFDGDGDDLGDHDYADADGVPDNGCEFQVDPAVIHVATPANGGLDAAGCGSPTAPCATLGYGIQRADAEPGKTKVWASSGAYYENITLVEGIDVVGGHSTINWSYAPATNVTVLYGTTTTPGDPDDRVVVRAVGINSAPTTFQGFIVYGEVVQGELGNSIGIYVEDCDGNLTVEDVTIYAGNGGPGIDGTGGANGTAGANGNPGVNAHSQNSCPDDAQNTTPLDPGGAGGALVCLGTNASGGDGGRNYCPDWDDNGGGFPAQPYAQTPDPSEAGNPGAGPVGGGGGELGWDRFSYKQGTPPTCSCLTPPGDEQWIGGDGSNGGDGSGGTGGSGCSDTDGVVLGGRWLGGVGTVGTGGTAGSGGGGGGTGGGVEDWDCNSGNGVHAVGGTGGGGGSGGCGGRSGFGGWGGGGSFGMYLYFSTAPSSAPQISANTIFTGRGGDGGNGGNGGIGGVGGTGAQGGASGTSGSNDWCAPPGGRGGEGGNGGAGGGGGGGCGGVSFGVFSYGQGGLNLNGIKVTNTFNLSGVGGSGGAGGISLTQDGGNGNDGATGQTNF